MRGSLQGFSGFIVLLLAVPGSANAGWFFQRSPSSVYTPAPTYRWGLANPSSLPAPSDYPDGASGYAAPPMYTSPYYYGPQTGYAFPYYHSYPGSYVGPRRYTADPVPPPAPPMSSFPRESVPLSPG